jgi:hypothetical protein
MSNHTGHSPPVIGAHVSSGVSMLQRTASPSLCAEEISNVHPVPTKRHQELHPHPARGRSILPYEPDLVSQTSRASTRSLYRSPSTFSARDHESVTSESSAGVFSAPSSPTSPTLSDDSHIHPAEGREHNPPDAAPPEPSFHQVNSTARSGSGEKQPPDTVMKVPLRQESPNGNAAGCKVPIRGQRAQHPPSIDAVISGGSSQSKGGNNRGRGGSGEPSVTESSKYGYVPSLHQCWYALLTAYAYAQAGDTWG